MVVRGKTAQILSMTVGRIPFNGHLAAKGQTKYAWTVNESPAACKRAVGQAAVAAKAVCTVSCDKASSYPKLVRAAIPHAILNAHKRAKLTGNFDLMFSLNHTCAKIRASVAVMARKNLDDYKVHNQAARQARHIHRGAQQVPVLLTHPLCVEARGTNSLLTRTQKNAASN